MGGGLDWVAYPGFLCYLTLQRTREHTAQWEFSAIRPKNNNQRPRTQSRNHVASDGTAASGLAARYAAALFDLATEGKKLDQTEKDLTRLKEVLAQSPELRRFIRSPVLTREQQTQGLTCLLEQVNADDLTQKFVRLVAQKRRLFALGDMVDVFLADLAHKRGEIDAGVTVARPLSDQQTEVMTATIRKALGDKVAIQVDVDPDLLGGMVVRVGSRMIDNSLRTKINKLQLAMKAPGGPL